MDENVLTMILKMILIILNFLQDSGNLDDVTDERLRQNMKDINEAVAKWN